MNTSIHKQILIQSLTPFFSNTALKQIIEANIRQDSILYSIGHDHFHYDNDAIAASNEYLKEQRYLVINSLRVKKNAYLARCAFGRLTHVAQDFYAHTDYISLWASQNKFSQPEHVTPLDQGILSENKLRSGKIYFRELLTLIPFVGHMFVDLMPLDSHARMNIDDINRPYFDFVFVASKKRTLYEYELSTAKLTKNEKRTFTGL